MNCFLRTQLLLFALLFWFTEVDAQLLSWAPQFPNDNSAITVTMDATQGNQGLLNYTGTVYMHFGLITSASTSSSDWRYSPTTWGTTTAPVATPLGNNKWSFTINNPRAYFNTAAGGVPQGETILRIAILFRSGDGALAQRNAGGGDMYIPIYPAGTNQIQFTDPFIQPAYNISHVQVNPTLNQPLPVTAVASTAAGTLNLYYNGTLIAGPLTGTATISGNAVITSAGNQQIVSELLIGGVSYYDTIKFYQAPSNTISALPPGVKEGINYWPGCDSVTLVLYAPNKLNAVVLGDFPNSNWVYQPQFQMNKTPDGNYYWITIRGLTPGTEYAFEYLVDNSIYVADPYSEKVLDPWNDPYIPASTYPGLKPYPGNANVSAGINGIVSVLQTCAAPYNWQVNNFVKPDKRNLVIYELLVRDFGSAQNYQMLIDTISYFKRLGINAIELMPVAEFSGNQSWGYNPEFYLALDKAYGTKDKFKEFIDLCHKNGIAVILDVVYNQLDAYNAPEGKLYWDAVNNRPAANNPWLNTFAPHPYSVFNDLNHTTAATQYWVSRALEYWLTEYKVDGYRFDLAKGFTQTPTIDSTNVTVEDFDQSRVNNLSRYYDSIIPKFPGTYMILEFLGTYRSEEQEYVRRGFMLWGENTYAYNQSTMGYADGADFSKIVYKSGQEQFNSPAEVGFMESHDKERLMYKNLQFGNSSGGYDVKNLATALEREAAAAAVFFTVPGPKMLWQFGERGYDFSITSCHPGNFIPQPYPKDSCRTDGKPPHWEYMTDPNRLKLWDAYSKLINLRLSNPAVFNSTLFTWDFNDNGGLFRRFQIADPAASGMKVTVIANFDVVPQTRTITFQTTGNWYNYLDNGVGTGINGPTGSIFNLAATDQNITLQPGEYHVYINQPSNIYTFIGNGNWNDASNWMYNSVPPSLLPAGSEIIISPQSGGQCIMNVPQSIGPGAKFSVTDGKSLTIPLNLTIQ